MLLLPSTLTAREASDTLGMLTEALKRERDEPRVVVDASPLQHLDSAALAVLLELERLARAWGRGFAIHAAPSKLVAVARLYGVESLLFGDRTAASADPAAAQRSPAT